MNIDEEATLHLKFIEEFTDGYQIKANTNGDAIFNWFMNHIHSLLKQQIRQAKIEENKYWLEKFPRLDRHKKRISELEKEK